MKKLIKLTVAALAAGAVITAAGCSSTLVNNTVMRSNWFASISYNGIQSSFIEGNEFFSKEEIVYDVTYNSSYENNETYSLEYKDGTYTTEFYATAYDWNADNIPASYRSKLTETVYYYKTKLDISVKFIMHTGEESEWFNDSIITESYFRSAENGLIPIYSKQQLKTTSPAALKAESLDKAYTKVDVTYENFYNRKCTEVTGITRKAGSEDESKTYTIKNTGDLFFDNTAIYIAARGLKLSTGEITTVNENVSVFSAADKKICTYSLGGLIFELGSEERTKVTQALTASGLYQPKTSADGSTTADPGVTSVAVSINNVSGVLKGQPQYVWFASVENQDNNVSRATMLKMMIPLSYNLGVLTFSLNEVKSTLWNE